MSRADYHPNSLDAALSRIETEQKNTNAILVKILRSMETHERRIQSLERSRYWLVGAAAGATLLIRVLWEWIKSSGKS
jgi:hypothetical protein